MDSILSVKGLSKEFKNFKLGEIDLDIPKGFSTALIGTNGAGKTTLLDILSGISLKYGGEIRYFGEYDSVNKGNVRNEIGYTSAQNYFGIDWKLKNIKGVLSAAFDNFSCDEFDKWIESFGIDMKGKKVMNHSDGNIMRLMLASVLARDTRLLILDEPASPLDPVMRDRLCDIFREYTADGEKSVLFSTHNIADMENVTDYAVIMADGKIIEKGFADDLRDKYILVHGDKSIEKYKGEFIDCTGGVTGFEGIAPESRRHIFENGDFIIEMPRLQQICVALLKNAERNNKR